MLLSRYSGQSSVIFQVCVFDKKHTTFADFDRDQRLPCHAFLVPDFTVVDNSPSFRTKTLV